MFCAGGAGRLLIAPVGIEISDGVSVSLLIVQLLIAPVGIEIRPELHRWFGH